MKTLFDNDRQFRFTRDKRGRFATAERALYEKTAKENAFLRQQVEKYRRQAEVLSRSVSSLERQLRGIA